MAPPSPAPSRDVGRNPTEQIGCGQEKGKNVRARGSLTPPNAGPWPEFLCCLQGTRGEPLGAPWRPPHQQSLRSQSRPPHLSTPPTPASGNFQSVLNIYELFKKNLYSTFVSLSITPSWFTYIVADSRISFILMAEQLPIFCVCVYIYMYVTFSLSMHLSMDT